jgi:UDP-glucose/GDP-mannose dehydrogenase family, central domain
MAEIYRPLYLNKAPILYTSRRTAELIKYTANAFLATKIAFINEIADLAEEVGADVRRLLEVSGLTTGSGPNFCIPAQVLGARVFRKTPEPCSRPRTIMRCRCASWRPSLRPTTCANARWREKWQPLSEARSAARSLLYLG